MKVGLATFFAALLATAGAVWVAYYNAKEQRELEREQFQSSLIQQSIDFKDYKQSRANLSFLISVGLIAEGNSKINAFIRDTSVHLGRAIDKLPVAAPSTSKPYKRGQFSESFLTGSIIDALTKRPVNGATVIVEAYLRRYRGHPEPPAAESERMVTGRDGKYQVHKPWEDYFLYVQRPGYEPLTISTLQLFDVPDKQVIELARKEEQ